MLLDNVNDSEQLAFVLERIQTFSQPVFLTALGVKSESRRSTHSECYAIDLISSLVMPFITLPAVYTLYGARIRGCSAPVTRQSPKS